MTIVAALLAPAAAPRVAVVILNWNGIADTRVAVRSVLAQTYPNVVTIVADNGSASDEAGALRREFGEESETNAAGNVVVVENGQNLGFCGGNNRGAEHARALVADYLLFLNNDATLAPDAIARIMAAMEADPTIGAASPLIFHAHAPGEAWFASGALRLDHPLLAYPSPDLGKESRSAGALAESVAESVWACGCAFAIATDLFFHLGGFDERLFFYHEDVDLSLKVNRAGRRCVVLPGAHAWHVGSASGGGTFSRAHLYLTTRNGWHIVRRYASWGQRARYGVRFWPRTLALLHALLLWDADAPVRAGALWQGVKDGLRGRTGPVPAGVREQTPEIRARWQRRRRLAQTLAALLPGPHRWLRRRLAGGYLPPLPATRTTVGEGRAA